MAGNTRYPKLQACQIGRRLDLFPEPASHLCAGISAGVSDHTVFLEEFISQLFTAALVPPGILHSRIQAEWHRRVDRERGILADVIMGVTAPNHRPAAKGLSSVLNQSVDDMLL